MIKSICLRNEDMNIEILPYIVDQEELIKRLTEYKQASKLDYDLILVKSNCIEWDYELEKANENLYIENDNELESFKYDLGKHKNAICML